VRRAGSSPGAPHPGRARGLLHVPASACARGAVRRPFQAPPRRAARRPGTVTAGLVREGLYPVMVPGAHEEDLDAMLERLLLDDEVEQAGSYSVMVPGPPDEAALEATIARLMLGDDPPSELLVVAGDAQARAVGELVALAHPGLVQVVAEEELFDTTIRDATVPW